MTRIRRRRARDSVGGTAVGHVFLDAPPRRVRQPRRRSPASCDDRPGRRWCCPCAPPRPSPGCWSRCGPPGAPPFTDEQLDMMAAFADQAALAWQLATAQRMDAGTRRALRPRPHRPRPARPRHPTSVRRRPRSAGHHPAGTSRPKYNNACRNVSTICKPSFEKSAPRSSTCTAGTGNHPAAPTARRSDRPVLGREIYAPRRSSSDRCRWSTPPGRSRRSGCA